MPHPGRPLRQHRLKLCDRPSGQRPVAAGTVTRAIVAHDVSSDPGMDHRQFAWLRHRLVPWPLANRLDLLDGEHRCFAIPHPSHLYRSLCCSSVSRRKQKWSSSSMSACGRCCSERLAAFVRRRAACWRWHEKAVECLSEDRVPLLAFYDFPAEHWKHLRTTNPIESTFATVRHRTIRSRGCLSNKTALAMIFKLAQAAEIQRSDAADRLDCARSCLSLTYSVADSIEANVI